MEQNKMIFKVMRWLMILFMVFGVVFTAVISLQGSDALKENASLNLFFQGTYLLLIGTVVLAILFPIVGFFGDIKKGMRVLVSIVFLAVLFGVAYMFASDSVAGDVYQKMNVGPTQSRVIEAGLIMTYLLAALSIVAVIYASVSSLFKR